MLKSGYRINLILKAKKCLANRTLCSLDQNATLDRLTKPDLKIVFFTKELFLDFDDIDQPFKEKVNIVHTVRKDPFEINETLACDF